MIDTESVLKKITETANEIKQSYSNILIIVPKELYYQWWNEYICGITVTTFLTHELNFHVNKDNCCLSNMLFVVALDCFELEPDDIAVKDLHLTTNKDAVKLVLL